ncbi:hypothetical protein J6590_076354 [Homalodisca vitripennis]|nr:hypothetical protein J6590_076354 [Homalodisca vitripennis]
MIIVKQNDSQEPVRQTPQSRLSGILETHILVRFGLPSIDDCSTTKTTIFSDALDRSPQAKLVVGGRRGHEGDRNLETARRTADVTSKCTVSFIRWKRRGVDYGKLLPVGEIDPE